MYPARIDCIIPSKVYRFNPTVGYSLRVLESRTVVYAEVCWLLRSQKYYIAVTNNTRNYNVHSTKGRIVKLNINVELPPTDCIHSHAHVCMNFTT